MKNITRFVLLVSVIFVTGMGCKSKADSTEVGPISDIFAGVSNVFILKADNTLWGAGYNRLNQLGLSNATSGSSTSGLQAACINDDTGTPFSGVKTVAAGENHTVILKQDGTLWGAGDSPNGELGQPKKFQVFTRLKAGDALLSGVKEVAVGNNTTLFINSDGSLWVSGYNYYGELGLKNRDAQPSFIKAEGAGQNVKAIAAGLRHTAILKEDGTLWTAGYNYNGQLGLGDTEDKNYFSEVKDAGSGIIAVACGNYHTVILKSDGSVWAAGSNYWGQLGLADSDDKVKFTRVTDDKGSPLTGVREIAARGDITVLLKTDGSLLLAGNYTDTEGANVQDAAGDESKQASSAAPKEDKPEDKPGFIPLVPEQGAASKFGDVKKVVLGYNSIYVITSDGRLWVAGSNRYGQLSLGPDTVTSSQLRLIDM